MSKVSDHISPPVVGAVSCVVQRPASKPVSLFDLGARFFVPTRAAAGTPRAAAVKAGRRGASAALSAVARPRLDGGEHGVRLRADSPLICCSLPPGRVLRRIFA